MTSRLGFTRTALVAVAVLALLAALPPMLGARPGYTERLLIVGLLYIAAATAWDLVGGLAGQVSFGHATFFGVGAYVVAILTRVDVPLAIALIPAAVAAAVYGAAWGWPCLRLRGPFFAIATIGVGEATRLVAVNLESITGGATGLTLPVRSGAGHAPYYLALLVAAAAVLTARAVRSSRLGLGLACLREDAAAAQSIGIRVGWVQTQALMISAALVGLAGGVYARFLLYVEPGDVFSFNRSVSLILMTTIGGVNSVWGPAAGAILFLLLEQFLAASFPQLHLGIYGALLALVMMFEPRGLLPLLARVAPRRMGVAFRAAG